MSNQRVDMNLERGQSLTEFAFGFLVLVLLIAGIVDLGRAFFTYMALNDAVQEGALYGSLNPTNEAGIRSRVQGIAVGPIDMSQVKVDVDIKGSACTGNPIVVTGEYTFQITMPLIGAIVGDQNLAIRATVADYIVSPPCP
jgi:Flp pilus assembly protein TadG